MAESHFINHCYQGNIISLRPSDGFINATAMAVANGKNIRDWFRIEATLEVCIELFKRLNPENSISAPDPNLDLAKVSASWYAKQFPGLVYVRRGSPETGGGTWVHPKLAPICGQWCSVSFALQVSDWVMDWMIHGKSPATVTPEQVVALLTRSDASMWKQRFEDEFYEHLSRLTGLTQDGHKRSKYWAALTNEFVYDLLPEGVSNALRKCRADGSGWDKLHQYLSPEGLSVFQDHMKTLVRDMEGVESINELRRIWANRSKHLYRKDLVQLALFNDNRKDGVLTPARAS